MTAKESVAFLLELKLRGVEDWQIAGFVWTVLEAPEFLPRFTNLAATSTYWQWPFLKYREPPGSDKHSAFNDWVLLRKSVPGWYEPNHDPQNYAPRWMEALEKLNELAALEETPEKGSNDS